MSPAPPNPHLRRLLAPLTPLYAAALALKNTAYTRNWLAPRRLQAPVISIGNLSVGGAGKTPLVIHLAQLLTARGYSVDILSRGYGRLTQIPAQVLPDPSPVSDSAVTPSPDNAATPDSTAAVTPSAAELYGDEPLLIAQATGLPVYVAASRYAAGLLAEQAQTIPAAMPPSPKPHCREQTPPPEQAPSLEKNAPPASSAHAVQSTPTSTPAPLAAPLTPPAFPHLHLLDDGFQHRQLARAVDIVLLHRTDIETTLLPAGRLREPLSSLTRASIVVLREQDAHLAPELHRRFPHLLLWQITRELVLPEALLLSPRPAAAPLSSPTPPTAIAFCGIAHPSEFFQSLTRAGVPLLATHAFPDHHPYTSADIAALAHSAQSTGAHALLTTEKDLVRLSPHHRAALNHAAPLHAVPLRVRLTDQDAALTELLTLAHLN